MANRNQKRVREAHRKEQKKTRRQPIDANTAMRQQRKMTWRKRAWLTKHNPNVRGGYDEHQDITITDVLMAAAR